MRPIRATAAAATTAVALVLTGCTPSPTVDSSTATHLEPAVAPQDDLGTFVAPMWLDVPPVLVRVTSANRFVGWTLAGDADDGVRLMAPTTIRPGGSSARPAPADYSAAIRALTARGAHVVEGGPVRIDGAFGSRFTVRAVRPIEAGLGCWSPAPDDCFSLAPGLTAQVAVFSHGGRPLVLWLRTWHARPSPALTAAFERLLDSLTFVD